MIKYIINIGSVIVNAIINCFLPYPLEEMQRINTYFDSLGKEKLLKNITGITQQKIHPFILKKTIICADGFGIDDNDLLPLVQDAFTFCPIYNDFESFAYRKMRCFVTGRKFMY